MNRLAFAIMLLASQLSWAQERFDITPKNANEYGIKVNKVHYGNGYKFQIEFPPIKDGMEGFAAINVAYAKQPTDELRTVQIPQFNGIAIITGEAAGLKQSFAVITYSINSDIVQILSLYLGDWLEE